MRRESTLDRRCPRDEIGLRRVYDRRGRIHHVHRGGQGRRSAGNLHFPDARARHWTRHGFHSRFEGLSSQLNTLRGLFREGLYSQLQPLSAAGLQSLSLFQHSLGRCRQALLLKGRGGERLFDGPLLSLEGRADILIASRDQKVSHRETACPFGVDGLDPKPLPVVLNSLFKNPHDHPGIDLSQQTWVGPGRSLNDPGLGLAGSAKGMFNERMLRRDGLNRVDRVDPLPLVRRGAARDKEKRDTKHSKSREALEEMTTCALA